jgi:hypothetical protein
MGLVVWKLQPIPVWGRRETPCVLNELPAISPLLPLPSVTIHRGPRLT